VTRNGGAAETVTDARESRYDLQVWILTKLTIRFCRKPGGVPPD